MIGHADINAFLGTNSRSTAYFSQFGRAAFSGCNEIVVQTAPAAVDSSALATCRRSRRFVWPQSEIGRPYQFQYVSADGLAARQRAGRKLDGGIRANRRGKTPRSYAMTRLRHPSASRHKRDIDGKSHKERVDRVGRRNDHRLAVREVVAAQQAAPAGLRVERRRQLMRQDPSIPGVLQEPPGVWIAKQRTQEKFLHRVSTDAISLQLAAQGGP